MILVLCFQTEDLTNWCVLPWGSLPLPSHLSSVAYSFLCRLGTPGLSCVWFGMVIGVILVQLMFWQSCLLDLICAASDITGRHNMRRNFTTNSMVLIPSILSSSMFPDIVMALFCRYSYLNRVTKLFPYCSLSVAKRKINLWGHGFFCYVLVSFICEGMSVCACVCVFLLSVFNILVWLCMISVLNVKY